jgi:hypothetical protein
MIQFPSSTCIIWAWDNSTLNMNNAQEHLGVSLFENYDLKVIGKLNNI